MPRFAANLSLMFTEMPVPRPFRRGGPRAGFTAVEFPLPYDHPAEAVGERLHRNKLTQALFNLPPGNWDARRKGLCRVAGPLCRPATELSRSTALRAGDRRQAPCT